MVSNHLNNLFLQPSLARQLFISPASNEIAGFGSCVSSLMLSETLSVVFSFGICLGVGVGGGEDSCHVHESLSPIECRMEARW